MRSNIARTCGSSRVPGARPAVIGTKLLVALQLPEERDHRVELVRLGLLQVRERRHRRGRVDERSRDRLRREPRGDLRQRRPGTAVAVLTDLVARQAAGLADDELAALVL